MTHQDFTQKVANIINNVNRIQQELDKMRAALTQYSRSAISVTTAGHSIVFSNIEDAEKIIQLVEELATKRIDMELKTVSELISTNLLDDKKDKDDKTLEE